MARVGEARASYRKVGSKGLRIGTLDIFATTPETKDNNKVGWLHASSHPPTLPGPPSPPVQPSTSPPPPPRDLADPATLATWARRHLQPFYLPPPPDPPRRFTCADRASTWGAPPSPPSLAPPGRPLAIERTSN